MLALAMIVTYMPTGLFVYAEDDKAAAAYDNQSESSVSATDDSVTQGNQNESGDNHAEAGAAGEVEVNVDKADITGQDTEEENVDASADESGNAKGDTDPKGSDCSDNHGTDIVTDKYHVSWRFLWSNGGGSAGGSYEFKNPVTGEASEDHTYLFYHPQTWNNQNANLMVELTFSGEEDQSVKAGAIEIRIPLSVFSGWDGKSADKIVTQVPKAPEQNAQSNFNYEIDEENQEIVIHNFNEISGNDYLSVEFSYNVCPLDINGGMPDEDAARAAGFTDPSYGLGAAAGSRDIDRYCWNNNGRYLWKDYYRNEGFNCSITLDPDLDGEADYYDMKNPLSVAMATRAGGTTKTSAMPDQKSGVYTSWQSTWGTRPSDADQFVYVVWNINYTTLTNYNVNQPYGVDMFYDETYPAITFGEGENAKIVYGEQVGSMMHTWSQLGGGSYWSNLTVWGGDGSRGYYPGLGTTTTNSNGKNNHVTFFKSKHATTFKHSKTGQALDFGARVNTFSEEHSASQNPNFVCLVKYRISEILDYAEEYGIDLEHDGIKIYGQYYGTETWESGYTINRISRGVAELFIVDRSGKGVWTKRHLSDTFESNITRGGQTVLSNGTQVDLCTNSVDGFIRYPYRISYNGTAPYRTVTTTDENGTEVSTSVLVPQRLEMEEVQLMLSSAGAKHPRGWQPNGDDAAARPVGTGYEGDGNYFLADDDYTIPRFDVLKFEDYQGDFAAGVWSEGGLLPYAEYKPMFIYVRYANTDEYVPYCAVVKTSSTDHKVWKCDPTETDENGYPKIYKNNANLITPSDQHFALPPGVTGIKYVHETSEKVFRMTVQVTVHVKIKPTDAVKECINADLEHTNADGVLAPVNTYVKNIAKYAVYDGKKDSAKGGNWESEPRLSGDNWANGNGVAEDVIWILNRITNGMWTSKSTYVPPDSDPAQSAANLQDMEIGYVKLQACNEAGISNNIVYTTNEEDPYKLIQGTFYELLPKGTNIRANSIFGVYNETWSSHQYTAAKYTDWVRYKDLGAKVNNSITDGNRYFLAGEGIDYTVSTEYIPSLDQNLVRIDYSFPDPKINGCPDSSWKCFVAFFFIVENTYANIRARGTSTQNYMAFENTLDGGRSAVSSNYTITASHLNNNADVAALFQSKTADNSKRAACATASMTWNTVTVLEANYTKTVAVPETLDGLPERETYTADGGRVTVNNRYIYRLQLTNMPTTRADNIILYDILESGTTSEESYWQGKFESVDTSLIAETPSDRSTKHAKCDPVVYYSTKLSGKIGLEGNTAPVPASMVDVHNEEYWSTTCPDDPSTVTAIAIDCSKAKAPDGTEEDFHLGPKGTLTAFVHMTAPPEMVRKADGSIDVDAVAVNGSLVSIRPFNETPGDISENNSWLMSRASVLLRDVDVSLVKASDPKTGTPSARTIVDSDGTGTITYRLRVRNVMPFDCNDIVITDPIPEHLTIDKITVKLNGSSNETDGDSTTGFSYDLASDGRSLTFNITQQHPTVLQLKENGEPDTDADGNEIVLTDKDTYIYIYTTVDTLNAVYGADGDVIQEQVFLRDYDNTATLETANGKVYDEDTETMYHRAETAKIDIEKVWDDFDDRYQKRPDSIKLTLKGVYDTDKNIDPVTITVTPDADGHWYGKFENLSKYKVITDDADYDTPNTWYEIDYSIEEEEIFDPADSSKPIYNTEYSGITGSGGQYSMTVTNRYNGNIELSVTKAWQNPDGTTDAPDGAEVTFTLYKDGEATDETVVLDGTPDTKEADKAGYESEAWKATFTGLPRYKTVNGKEVEIEYTVKETGAWSNYTVSYGGKDVTYAVDGGVITNSRSEGSTEIKIRKVLNGRKFESGDSWTFTLSGNGPMPDKTSVTITPDVSDPESAKASFGEIKYGPEDAGKTYSYTIAESGQVDNVKNADPVRFTVTVREDGDGKLKVTRSPDETEYVFTNEYTADPPTGDSTNILIPAAVFVGALILFILFIMKRKKNK